jgi:hypothetical protein
MRRTIDIRRSAGKNLRSTIARQLAGSVPEIFKELGSNAYDADATLLEITVDREADRIIIDDNGTGMGLAGIEGFYKMGGSGKVKNPISARGRKRIGKFGIATVLLEFLAEHATLETWEGGEKYTVHEDFGSGTNSLDYVVTKDREKEHGTRITLDSVKIWDSIKGRNIQRALTWELPLGEDGFEITYNEERLVRKRPPPTTEFNFNVMLKYAGNISGRIAYYEAGAEDPGVFVYVHGRAVGATSQILRTMRTRRLGPYVIAEIQADGLSDHVLFDRMSFQMENRAVAEALREIRIRLTSVYEEVWQQRATKKAKKGRKVIESALTKLNHTPVRLATLERNNKREISVVPPSTGLNGHSHPLVTLSSSSVAYVPATSDSAPSNLSAREDLQAERGLRYELVDRGLKGSVASINPDENIIEINASHPFFSLIGKVQASSLQAQFRTAAAVALGTRRAGEEYGSDAERVLNERDELVGALASHVFDTDATLVEMLVAGLHVDGKRSLSPDRLYRRAEIQSITGLGLGTIKVLDSVGLFTSVGGDLLYKGDEVIFVMERLEGYTPASALVRTYVDEHELGITRQGRDQRVKAVNSLLTKYDGEIEYMVDIGTREPFFVIEDEHVQKFVTAYGRGLFSGRGSSPIPPELATREGKAAVPYSTLAEAGVTLGLTAQQLLEAFDTSLERGPQVKTRDDDGLTTYNMGNLRTMME